MSEPLNVVLHFVFEEETSEVMAVDLTQMPPGHLAHLKACLGEGEVVGGPHDLYEAALGARIDMPAPIEAILTVWEG